MAESFRFHQSMSAAQVGPEMATGVAWDEMNDARGISPGVDFLRLQRQGAAEQKCEYGHSVHHTTSISQSREQ